MGQYRVRVDGRFAALSEGAPGSVPVRVRAAALEALEAEMEPVDPPAVGTQRWVVHLRAGEEARLGRMAETRGEPLSRVLAGLTHAWVLARARAETPEGAGRPPGPDHESPEAPGERAARDLRPEQQGLHREVLRALGQGQIVFAEASTGFGKSRVMAHLALDRRRSGAARVVVAAPTLAVLGHLGAEMVAVAAARGEALDVAVRPSRGQFVDVTRLRAFLAADGVLGEDARVSAPERAAALAWLDAGGPLGEGTRGIGALMPEGAGYLVEDLERLAPGVAELGGGEWGLDDTSAGAQENPGAAAYARVKAAFADGTGPSILLVTHAMLAVDAHVRVKTGDARSVLPEYDTLLLDEAHLFEGALAGAVESQIAPEGIARVLARDRKEIEEAGLREHARWLARRTRRYRDEWAYASEVQGAGPRRGPAPRCPSPVAYDPLSEAWAAAMRYLADILPWVQALGEAREGARPARFRRYFREVARDIETLLRRGERMLGYLTLHYAPVTGAPSVHSGPRSYRAWHERLWSVQAAALFSATLYPVPGDDGYLGRLLGVPGERRTPLTSRQAPWVRRNVTLYLPDADLSRDLVPANGRSPGGDAGGTDILETEDEARYYDTLAQVLRHVAGSAEGGVLVLLTAYRAAAALAGRIEGDAPLVTARPGWSVPAQERVFREHRAQGARPLWLALGAAWQGIDLREPGPGPDRLLTDLVVPRVPLRMADSSDEQRQRHRGGQSRLDAAFQLRQGLGRLVRHEGATGRRCWVLDGRLNREVAAELDADRRRGHRKGGGWAWLLGPSRMVLEIYPRQAVIGRREVMGDPLGRV